jgi:hypothetical protein
MGEVCSYMLRRPASRGPLPFLRAEGQQKLSSSPSRRSARSSVRPRSAPTIPEPPQYMRVEPLWMLNVLNHRGAAQEEVLAVPSFDKVQQRSRRARWSQVPLSSRPRTTWCGPDHPDCEIPLPYRMPFGVQPWTESIDFSTAPGWTGRRTVRLIQRSFRQPCSLPCSGAPPRSRRVGRSCRSAQTTSLQQSV